MVNDLTRGACPAADVKCLVVDEAHKALGNYAYCQVVRELLKYTHHFRILALSATPGSHVKVITYLSLVPAVSMREAPRLTWLSRPHQYKDLSTAMFCGLAQLLSRTGPGLHP